MRASRYSTRKIVPGFGPESESCRAAFATDSTPPVSAYQMDSRLAEFLCQSRQGLLRLIVTEKLVALPSATLCDWTPVTRTPIFSSDGHCTSPKIS
jgi:hypothetical protein